MNPALEKKKDMKALHIDSWLHLGFVILLCITLPFAASCTKEHDPGAGDPKKPIKFTVVADKTKAIVSGTTLPETYTIYASAYFTSFTAPEADGDYFVAKPFHLFSGVWTSDPAIYWPVGGKLDILSLACEDEKMDVHKSAAWHEGNCSEGIEVTLKDGDCPDSEILFAAAYNRTVDGGSVPMQFRHAQSWLQFVINCDTEIIRIDRIVLESAYTGGLFRVSNNVYMDAEWSFRGHRRTDMTVPGSEGIIPETGTPSVCNVLVPEQEACTIAIHYSVRNSASSDWSDATSTVYRYKAGPNPWYYGEKNVLLINFSFTQITMLASVESWDDKVEDVVIEEGE